MQPRPGGPAGESRPETDHQDGPWETAVDQALENEQHRRSTHVAIVAEDIALEVERARGQSERGLDRIDDLDPARMAAEAGDRITRLSDSAEDFVDRAFEMLLDEGRDRAVEYDGEARVLDVPAHD